MLTIDRAQAIVEYHDRYKYASVEHVLATILWETGCRIGGAHSLDVDDCHLDPDDAEPYVEFRHRPPQTTLKNGRDGERLVSISQSLASVLDDYIEQNRAVVMDDVGRDPLFTSSHGRYHKNMLRNLVYGMTRPCVVSGECPHARDVEDCEAARRRNDACKCPTSKSPHAVRRASITFMLREGTPTKVVSDRANVEVRVLEDHYDSRTPEERMEVRREYIPEFQE